MNLKMKKVIAWVLVCLCVYGSMPKEMVKAASSGTIYFVPKGQQGRYTSNLDEALQSCSSRGGEIVLEKDVHYDFPDFIYYDTRFLIYSYCIPFSIRCHFCTSKSLCNHYTPL